MTLKAECSARAALTGLSPTDPPKTDTAWVRVNFQHTLLNSDVHLFRMLKDIDECALGFCGVNSFGCENSPFPYVCHCQQGFYFDASVYGNNCSGIETKIANQVPSLNVICLTDIDECVSEVCGENSLQCSNDVGSYSCTCQQGYEYKPEIYFSGCTGRA